MTSSDTQPLMAVRRKAAIQVPETEPGLAATKSIILKAAIWMTS